MKKILIKINIILIIILILSIIKGNRLFAIDEIDESVNKYGINSFINNSKMYIKDLNIDISSVFKNLLKGEFDNKKLFEILLSIFDKNTKEIIYSISGIVAVILINCLLKAISENLGNDSVSKIAEYVQYILIVTILMKNFSEIIVEIKESIFNLTAFSNSLIPLMVTLIISTGNIVTSSIVEPILLLIISFIGNFVINVIIPMIFVATTLGIISKIGTNIQVDKISKFFKKSSVWIITTILSLFITIASLEGGVTSNLDAVTKKTGKSIVSTAIPVVGGILGDAIDTICGYSNLLKNAVGTIGIIVIIGICIKPIIRLTLYTILYSFASAICEVIASKNITELIEEIASTFKVLLAIMITITVMIIIGLAIIMKITS